MSLSFFYPLSLTKIFVIAVSFITNIIPFFWVPVNIQLIKEV